LFRSRCVWLVTVMAAILAGMIGGHEPATAGSSNSTDTWAGAYESGSLPPGTVLAIQYAGSAHSDAFVDTRGNHIPDSHANIWLEYTRFSYFAQLWGHPLVLEAEIPFATLTDANIPGTNSRVAGGFADPVAQFTYFFTADSKIQRWLGFTNY